MAKRPRCFADCVKIARLKFEKVFSHRIQQLLHVLPADKMDGDRPFWSLPRRLPRVLQFDSADSSHMDYVVSLAMLYAKLFGFQVKEDEIAEAAAVAAAIDVPAFHPKGQKKHEFDESLTDEQRKKLEEESVSTDEISSLEQSIEGLLTKEGDLELTKDEFEKDDDSNYHIAYITAASNLRARNYSIPEVDFFRTKIIAGKIIPAIATTTSIVSALVVTELLKIMQGLDVGDHRNAFLNLALPIIQLSEPAPPEKKTIPGNSVQFSEWDRWEVRLGAAVTLDQLLQHFKDEYDGLDAQAIFHGGKTVYMASMPTHASRKKKKLHELPGIKVKPDQVPYVDLAVAFLDSTQGTVSDEAPGIRVYFR